MNFDSLAVGDNAEAGITAGPTLDAAELGLRGAFVMEAYDEDGNLKWKEEFNNLVTNAGLDHALNVTLSGGTQSTSWYVGLVNGTSSPTFDPTDTMSSHSGWTEDQNYSEGSRQGWNDGGVSGQSVSNSGSQATFSINSATDIAGAFLVDDSTKGGTSGTLFAEGSFGSTRSLQNGDTLNVTYTINAS